MSSLGDLEGRRWGKGKGSKEEQEEDKITGNKGGKYKGKLARDRKEAWNRKEQQRRKSQERDELTRQEVEKK